MADDVNAQEDIPYGEDLCDPAGAAAWTQAADLKRPHRASVRNAIAKHISLLGNGLRVLGLGKELHWLLRLSCLNAGRARSPTQTPRAQLLCVCNRG